MVAQRYVANDAARDVQAALKLMLTLPLEHHSVNPCKSAVNDSLMYAIKMSSAPSDTTPELSPNSFGKVNENFCHFVIDYLSMALYFDCWHPYGLQNAPAPTQKKR